jgi:hypothetical protein
MEIKEKILPTMIDIEHVMKDMICVMENNHNNNTPIVVSIKGNTFKGINGKIFKMELGREIEISLEMFEIYTGIKLKQYITNKS